MFECDKCGKRFKHIKSLKRHNIHIPNCEPIQENIPGRCFGEFEQFSKITCRTKSSSIKQNVEQSTGPLEQRSDNLSFCQICLVSFSTPDKVQIHRDEYARIFQCCNCMKIMGYRQKLKAHHRTHTREKPFHCKFCEKIFSECSSFRKHLLTHEIIVPKGSLEKTIYINIWNQVFVWNKRNKMVLFSLCFIWYFAWFSHGWTTKTFLSKMISNHWLSYSFLVHTSSL